MIKFKSKKQKAKSKNEEKSNLSIFNFQFSISGGYTLLFAMIVASVVLAIGVSLLTISRKEFVLSSSATNSSASFYAADSGINCAEYWNNSGDEFGTSSLSRSPIFCSNVQGVSAATVSGSNNVTSITLPTGALSPAYEFTFNTPFSIDGTTVQGCARVTVDKYYAPNPSLGGVMYPYTTITSYGYTLGWNSNTKDCTTQSPRKVERAIQVTY